MSDIIRLTFRMHVMPLKRCLQSRKTCENHYTFSQVNSLNKVSIYYDIKWCLLLLLVFCKFGCAVRVNVLVKLINAYKHIKQMQNQLKMLFIYMDFAD